MTLKQAMTVTAHGDETLDALVWRALGRGPGSLERILEANPGLAAIAEAMPEGTPVIIPADAEEAADAGPGVIQLWD